VTFTGETRFPPCAPSLGTTSAARPAKPASLGRRGATLHVTNGGSVASSLRATSLEGVVLSWDDVLHVGPLAFDPEESRTIRARFLSEHGWGAEDAIHTELTRRDDLLGQAKRIVLWFEHDLWPSRRPVGHEARALARRTWRRVGAGEIEPVRVDSLPHLEAALVRLLEERAPLPRTKRQLLEALRDGPLRPLELFAANQAREEAVFLGDAWCFLFLWELARDGLVAPEPPPPPPRGDYDAFVAVPLELSPAGRRLV
jgi:hypothetical protein